MGKVIIDVPGLFNPEEAANIMGIGWATLWRWIKSGKLIPIIVSGRTLIPQSEIDRLNRERGKTQPDAEGEMASLAS